MNGRITCLATLFLLLSLSGLILRLNSTNRSVTPAPGTSGGQLHVRTSTGQQVNRSVGQQVRTSTGQQVNSSTSQQVHKSTGPHSAFRIPYSAFKKSAFRIPQSDHSEFRIPHSNNPQSVGLPLFFEPNQGQAEDSIKFMSGGSGLRLSLTHNEVVFALGSSVSQQARVAMRFLASNPSSEVVGEDRLPGKSNYLIGNDPSKWRTDLPQYAKVRYKQLYPGIDLIFYGSQQQLEYDLVVSPGVDPSVIKFGYTVDSPQSRRGRGDYADRKGSAKTLRALRLGGNKDLSLKIDANEDLVINTAAGEIRQLKPKIYQEINGVKFPIPGRYVLKTVASSQLPVASELSAVSDQTSAISGPVSRQVTRSSGPRVNRSAGQHVNIPHPEFHIPPSKNPQSAFRIPHSDHSEIRIPHSKQSCHPAHDTCLLVVAFQIDAYDPERPLVIDPQIVNSFQITNSGFNSPRAVTSDTAGNIYVAGETNATDFQRVNPLQGNFGGGTGDAYVIKVNPEGKAIIYSSYLGGSGEDAANGIAVDAAGNIYLAGLTTSTNFPTRNPFQSNFGGGATSSPDAFVAKLNPSGNAMEWRFE